MTDYTLWGRESVMSEQRLERYPMRNSSEREAARLGKLQALSDPITVRWFQQLGVAPGWHCAELGAGAGSMVEWLSDRVGVDGSVTAVDRDTSQLGVLGRRANVRLVSADLCGLELEPGALHLVHSRSVLMHLDCPDEVVRRAVDWLRPGGTVFFEETEGGPATSVEDAPEPYAAVMVPMARRWTWAGTLTPLLESCGLVDVHDDVRADPLVGGTPLAEFWQYTLASVADMVEQGAAAGRPDAPAFLEQVQAMSALLDDPDFVMPFTARHRVTGRKPA
ncbi:MAG: class I SAM-dependent methyltransferase [Acidimicrobiales bacterium]